MELKIKMEWLLEAGVKRWSRLADAGTVRMEIQNGREKVRENRTWGWIKTSGKLLRKKKLLRRKGEGKGEKERVCPWKIKCVSKEDMNEGVSQCVNKS